VTDKAITIQNELSTPLSLDVKLDSDRVIRANLKPKGYAGGGDSVDVGEVATLDELNRDPVIRACLDASTPKISITVTPTTTDQIPSPPDFVSDTEGMGGLTVMSKAFVNAGGAADHDTVLKAAMPFAAKVLDSMVYLQTNDAACTKGVLQDALAGAGTELSVDYDITAAAGLQRHDGTYTAATDGTVPTIAKGAPLTFFRAGSDASVGTVVVVLQRLN